jgi:hypothetical protein
MAAALHTFEVIGDIMYHQYIPGVFPSNKNSRKIHEMLQHSVHHMLRLEPYGLAFKFVPPEPEPGPANQATAPSQTAQVAAPDRGVGASATPVQGNGGYTIDRSGGQIRVSGPGVSIVSSSANNAAGTQASAGRRAVDPFICEGRRTLQLDNRDIYVDGDAITVRSGCEVFITNSQIVASGTGIIVQDATVHVSNSHIEGASASFQAEDRAKMFVRGSTFQGVSRRAELATVQDQGGNRWR